MSQHVLFELSTVSEHCINRSSYIIQTSLIESFKHDHDDLNITLSHS